MTCWGEEDEEEVEMREERAVVDQKKGIMREVMMKTCVQLLNGQKLMWLVLRHIYKKNILLYL